MIDLSLGAINIFDYIKLEKKIFIEASDNKYSPVQGNQKLINELRVKKCSSEKDVLITAGASSAILSSLILLKYKHILIPDPGYPQYKKIVSYSI